MTSIALNRDCMTTIKLSEELGSTLVGRIPARELRARIEECAREGKMVTLDFDGVIGISPSFADEVFGRTDPDSVTLVNLSEHLAHVARIVRG